MATRSKCSTAEPERFLPTSFIVKGSDGQSNASTMPTTAPTARKQYGHALHNLEIRCAVWATRPVRSYGVACVLMAAIRWTRDFSMEQDTFVQKLRLIQIDVTTKAEAEQILGKGSRGTRHGKLTVYKYRGNWDVYYNDAASLG